MARYRIISGQHRFRDGKQYRPGEVLIADPHEVHFFLDKLQRLDPEEEETFPEKKVSFVLKPRRGNKFDVVDPDTGEAINAKPITKKEALRLMGEDGD